MKVTKTVNGNRMDVKPEGKINALTAPEFENEIAGYLEGITDLNFDFSAVDYISSACLRTLLYFRQILEEVNGTLTVRNVPPIVMDVFEATDFGSIITIL